MRINVFYWNPSPHLICKIFPRILIKPLLFIINITESPSIWLNLKFVFHLVQKLEPVLLEYLYIPLISSLLWLALNADVEKFPVNRTPHLHRFVNFVSTATLNASLINPNREKEMISRGAPSDPNPKKGHK